ncbi:hypothetical protein IWX90DRAFT_82131 [Phyllosticta citrichinensis]|uniref:Developmental regulator n=1 Tax=Phyllosticta citrichinensis TaxID=1130410 RepID=A0ABR1XG19_9PEZI
MPTYLLHGFRWPRNLIRIHIILQNLDDAAAEWLMAPATTKCLYENLKALHPQQLTALPRLRFIEQFDPELALSTPGGNVQPYAYVADVVEEVRLGVEVGDVMSRGVGNEAWAALTELRDHIALGERVGWFVVVCQDTERYVPKVQDEFVGVDDDGRRGEGLRLANGSDGLEAEQLDVQMQALKMDSVGVGAERPKTTTAAATAAAKSFIMKRKSNPEMRKTGLSNGAGHGAHHTNNNNNGADSSRPNTSSGAETTALPQQQQQQQQQQQRQQQTRKHPKKLPSTPRILGGKSTSSVNSMPPVPTTPSVTSSGAPPLSPRTSGVRKWFGGLGVPLRKARSLKDLRKLEAEKAKEMTMPPPLPGTAV